MVNRISGDYFQALHDINTCGSPEGAQRKPTSNGFLEAVGSTSGARQMPTIRNKNRMELRSGAGKLAAPKAHEVSPQFLPGSSVQEELVGTISAGTATLDRVD